MRQNGDWAAGRIFDNLRMIDPQVMVDRRQQILRCDSIADRIFAFRIRLPDHLSHPQSATRDQGTEGMGPVIASDLVRKILRGMCHAWRSSEFSAGDQQDFSIQAAFVQIIDQGAECLIHLWQSFALSMVEMKRTGVVIPTEVLRRVIRSGCVDVDHCRPGFCQSSRQQAALSPAMATVTVSHICRFSGDVERIDDFMTGQHGECRRSELIDTAVGQCSCYSSCLPTLSANDFQTGSE